MTQFKYDWESGEYKNKKGKAVSFQRVKESLSGKDFEDDPKAIVGMLSSLMKGLGRAKGEVDFMNQFIPKDKDHVYDQQDPTHSNPVHNTIDPEQPSASESDQNWTDVSDLVSSRSSVSLFFDNPTSVWQRDIGSANWRSDKKTTNNKWNKKGLGYLITFWSSNGKHQIAALSFNSFQDMKSYISNTYDAARLKVYNYYYDKYVKRRETKEDIGKRNRYNEGTYTPSNN